MRTYVAILMVPFLGAVLPMCGGGTTIVESTPRPGPAPKMEPLLQPTGKLVVPVPEIPWTPVMIGDAQKGASLARALRDKRTLALVLPRGMGASPEFENRVFQMVRAASPDTRIVARGTAVLDQLLEERGEIPYRVTLEQSGTNVLGNPVFIPKEHPLNTDWLSKKKPLKGAEGILVVRPIRVDDIRMRALRRGRIGGCDDMLNALEEAMSSGAGFFSSYSDEASKRLQTEFSRQLKPALPFWQGELARSAAAAPPGSAEARCASEYRNLVDKYAPCVEGACPVAPSLFVEGGGVVGISDETLLVPKTCPTPGMRDYVAELRDLSLRAVAEVLPALDGGWAGELIKYRSLGELKRVIGEACAPRHRRIADDELEKTRNAVTAFLSNLKPAEIEAVWLEADGQERVPGVGAVTVLAKVRASSADPVVEISNIAESLRALDRCDEKGESLLQASLIDVNTSEVLFMDIFFEEELLCDGLPPG